ncbi:MAG TPA: hypothetical protein VLC09_08890, partial [Polyangiaceae bacterium]|nr:hypothetical protein [Polyangiaceae bacterium]
MNVHRVTERKEEFHALSLLLQHRELIAWLDGLEFEMECIRRAGGEPTLARRAHTRLLARLGAFTTHLAQHFERESRSTLQVFAEHPDGATRARVLSLDAEHPMLLAAFRDCHDKLDTG